ncbi:mechanosensitive ion channel family protein [Serratia sp. DD3]|uniref:mechanosensitive ion channel family protein n=1 Tax=Serratia sp. DD3 TaxID=1410619 RepID=UPI0003C52B6C|nr:mechanosensitive ion channel family protein [Serratia sp. DD3]KEY58544.1 small-conductance mechanosensitive channel [Serratia sp. DD3]
MHTLKLGEVNLLSFLSPDSLFGALIYLFLFILGALILSRGLSLTVSKAISRHEHLDRTTINFLQQLLSALIWVVSLILYAHLIPALRTMGTAMLAGASVVSVVLGLAAQSTLGNLIAGLAITIYRPFRLGDTLQVAVPSGTEIGVVQTISLGYTTLRTGDGRLVVIPNSAAASQVAVNLNVNSTHFPMRIKISIDRSVDIAAACSRAQALAAEVLGQQAVGCCILTHIDGAVAQLELCFHGEDSEAIAETRSKLLTRLASGFSGDPAWGPAPGPSFL